MSEPIKDISKLKVADLKRELKNRGLSSAGNKQELQDRLQMALQDGTDTALLLDDTGPVDTEDILNEDDVLADEDDSNANPTSDGGNVSLKRQIEDDLEEENIVRTPTGKSTSGQGQDCGPPAKKITLNRKAIAAQVTTVAPEKTPEATAEKSEASNGLTKVSSMSASERLALRAAKFNLAPTDTSRKESRKAKFGTVSASSVTSAAPEVSVDVLKKRAERFGIQPGSKIEQVELEEKKRKRLERFGSSGTAAANGAVNVAARTKTSETVPTAAKPGRIPITAPSNSSSDLDEKKKLRAERFKSTVTTK